MPLINIFILILAYLNIKKLQNETLLKLFRIFYADFEKKKKAGIWYQLMYFVRRDIFILASFVLTSEKYKRVWFITICLLNIFASILIVKVRDQRSKVLNNLEVANEFFIQAATLYLPIFELCSIDDQAMFGSSFIYCVIITISITLIIIL